MIRGSIYAFTDPNEAFNTIMSGCKVLVISEDIPVNPSDPNTISGSCLMPPPMAMMAMIDGDAERFYEEYSEYLLSDIPVDFISVIVGYLHTGGNLSMLLPAGLGEPWVCALLNHFMTYYGICIGTAMSQFSYNMQYNDCINDIIYSSGMESPYEYLVNHTIGMPFPNHILMQLQSQLSYVLSGDMQMEYNNLAAMLHSNPK